MSAVGPDLSQWSLTFEVRKRGDTTVTLTTRKPSMSQWSLTFEVRKRRQPIAAADRRGPVAMEPDL